MSVKLELPDEFIVRTVGALIESVGTDPPPVVLPLPEPEPEPLPDPLPDPPPDPLPVPPVVELFVVSLLLVLELAAGARRLMLQPANASPSRRVMAISKLRFLRSRVHLISSFSTL